MTELRVTLADAPRDVLVYLVDHGPTNIDELIEKVPPADADEPAVSVRRAIGLLTEGGWVRYTGATWSPTADGIAAVTAARSSLLVTGDGDTP